MTIPISHLPNANQRVPLDFFRVAVKQRRGGSEKLRRDQVFGQKREITRYAVSAQAKVHLAYRGYSSVRRVHAVRVEGKRAGSWPGGDGGGQQDEGEGGGNPRREPSNLVPSRLEVCKNKRERKREREREKRGRATCPGAPPIADSSRLVAVPAKITPLALQRAILSGRRGWPTAAATATCPRFRDSFRRYASLSASLPLTSYNFFEQLVVPR